MGKASLALALCFSTYSFASLSCNGQTSFLGDLFLWSVSVALSGAWEFCSGEPSVHVDDECVGI